MNWTILVVLIGLFFMIKNVIKADKSYRKSKADLDFSPYSDSNFKLGVYKTVLKGIRHRRLNNDDKGVFYGYAKAQTDNPYDEYAVAIYNNDGKHMGFAPRNYMTLHQSILDRGGQVYCCGVIRRGDINQDILLGDIYIDFDKNYWMIKNGDKRMTYKSPNLKMYKFMVYPAVAKKGRFYGNVSIIGKDNSKHLLNVSDGEKNIGVLEIDSVPYNSIEDFHDGNVVAWGYIQVEKCTTEVYHGYVCIPIKCSQDKINKELDEFKSKNIRFTI